MPVIWDENTMTLMWRHCYGIAVGSDVTRVPTIEEIIYIVSAIISNDILPLSYV